MALRDPSFAVLDAQMRDGFAASRARGEALHLREEARYRLAAGDDPRSLLDLALANWNAQHEPWDARLLLEVAGAARRPEAATPVREWLRGSGLQDARIPPETRP